MNQLQHIVFIIDGNRRWAKKRGRLSFFGHQEGGKNVERIAQECVKRDIPFITFWVLSTENVKNRSHSELSFLYKMIGDLPRRIEKMNNKNIKINIIGDISKLPKICQKSLQDVVRKTRKNKKAIITLAVNYGGRDEILRAVRKIMRRKVPLSQVTEELFASCLDTASLPDPSLVVRTGGKVRLSGILPWQCVYSEFYFTDIYWPAFTVRELEKALAYYQGVQRNFGK